jgi:hypothetical protein
MPAQQQHHVTTAFLSSGSVDVGQCAVKDAAGLGYVESTLANRTASGRQSSGIAISAGDPDNTAFELQVVGEIPPSITGLGAGTSTYVKVSDAGYLARTNTLDSSVVGRCDADGTAYVCFPLAGWSFGFTGFTAGGDLTGTSTSQTVAKIQGVAISGTAASGKTLVASGAAAASWQTLAVGASPAGSTGDIQVRVNSTTLGIVGFWTAVDNAGTLRASYWDSDGTTLRSVFQLSGGAFYPTETFANGGFIRISSAFATGSLSLIAAKVGIATVVGMGMSSGDWYFGDPNLINGTNLYGGSFMQITGGSGVVIDGSMMGTNVIGTGGLKVNGVAVTTSAATGSTAGLMSAADKTKLDGMQPEGAAGAVAAMAIDWSAGSVFTKTLAAGANTFTFSNATSGRMITVRVTGAASTLTWPTVKWPGGVAPTQTASGTDVYTFVHDGTNIYGTVVQAMA